MIRAVSPPVWVSHEHTKYGWSQFASKLHASELKENEYVSKNIYIKVIFADFLPCFKTVQNFVPVFPERKIFEPKF